MSRDEKKNLLLVNQYKKKLHFSGMLDVYINASMACTMIKTRSYVLVEIAEKFVDSLICNFNAYIYIYISKLISQVLCGEIVKPSKS